MYNESKGMSMETKRVPSILYTKISIFQLESILTSEICDSCVFKLKNLV